jgi:hypothetical protein
MLETVSNCNRRCVSVLLGGSGMSQIASQKTVDHGALLKPRVAGAVCRSIALNAVALQWEIDFYDLYFTNGCRH